MAISKRMRLEVLRRDGHTCRYCGSKAPDVPLTIDHVTPVTLGGADEPANLVTACKDCNAGKSSITPDAPLVADVEQDAIRWAAAIKLAAERKAAQRKPMIDYCNAFMQEWNEYCNGSIYDPIEPDGFADSIEGFFRAGLPLEELTRALAISMSRHKVGRYDKFRYMAGIAWSVLNELQEEARVLLGQEDGANEPGETYTQEALEAEWQRGFTFAFDALAYNDLPNQALLNVVEGTYPQPIGMKWTA